MSPKSPLLRKVGQARNPSGRSSGGSTAASASHKQQSAVPRKSPLEAPHSPKFVQRMAEVTNDFVDFVSPIIIRPSRPRSSGGGGESGSHRSTKDKLIHEVDSLTKENSWLRRRVVELELQLQQKEELIEQLEEEKKQYNTDDKSTRQHQYQHSHAHDFSGLPLLRARNVTVGKKVGEGSFGAVYKGQWRGVRCALKFVSQDTVDELSRESKLMDRIEHPNIV
jgi:Protein tyrosine and serine/threonine kinase